MKDWSDEFIGSLIPAVPIPYNENGVPDLSAVAQMAGFMKTQPVEGVALFTDIGHGSRLDNSLKRDIFQAWREFTGDSFYLIVDIGTSPVPPEITPDFLITKTLLPDSPVPMFIDSDFPVYDDFSHSLDNQNVAGVRIRLASNTELLQDTITTLRIRFPRKAILSGDDRMLGYSLYRGCHGAMAPSCMLYPKIHREMIDSWFMSEAPDFLKFSRMVDHLAESVCFEPRDGIAGRILAGLAHLGIIPENAAYDPSSTPLSQKEKELVTETLDALGDW